MNINSEIVSICDGIISNIVLAEMNTRAKSPLDIPEIVEAIVKTMSNPQLIQIRRVSKLWEAEASRAFLKRKVWRLLPCTPVNLIPVQWLIVGIQYRYHNYNMSDNQFKEMCSIISTSKNPQLLLKCVRCTSEWDLPIEIIPGCGNLLQDFGKFVTCLEIKEDEDFAVVNKLLGQDKPFCPNVEVLNFEASTSLAKGEAIPDPYPLAAVNSPWKLKQFAFTTQSATLRAPEQLALALLKNSPNLTSFHISSKYPAFTKNCFQLLEKMPQMITNLQTLSIYGDVLSLLKELSKVKFSRNLKSVEFRDLTRRRMDTHFLEIDLMEFLKIVGGSLEKLEIYQRGLFHNPKFTQDLPYMPNLKDLSLSGYTVKPTEGAGFLRKLPSLRYVMIGLGEDGNLHELLERTSQTGMIHKNLERIRLDISGINERCIYIDNPGTIRLLNKVFPSLTELWLVLREIPEGSVVDELRVWFEELFYEISQMKNLKHLEMTLGPLYHFERVDDSEDKLDLGKAFGNLKGSLCLERIVIERSNFKYKIPEELWLMELLEVPRIREIRFEGCTMGEKADLKMMEVFAQHNIIFDIIDKGDLFDGSVAEVEDVDDL